MCEPIDPQEVAGHWDELAELLAGEAAAYLAATCACCGRERPADGQRLCDACIAAECVTLYPCTREVEDA